MKTLYDAAAVLRKAIKKCQSWNFSGSLDSITEKHLPKELYSFFRWVVQGPKHVISAEKKSIEVHRRAMSLAQSTVAMFLTDRQVSNQKSEILRSTREMPQQLAVGSGIHQASIGKQMINILHGFGMAPDNNRILRVETQIERSAIKRMVENSGIYLPPDIVQGRHVFFAVDNIDFAEDTIDGKRTLHGTAMAIYQRSQPDDRKPDLVLGDPVQSRSIKELPQSITELMDCPKPASKPQCTAYPSFKLLNDVEIPSSVKRPDAVWLLGCTLMRPSTNCRETSTEPTTPHISDTLEPEPQPGNFLSILTWSGYHSLISHTMPVTRVGTPPLIAAPAHERQTLLTVLMQVQKINTKVVGPARKTVVSLDMGLYKPAKQLQMVRDDLNHFIL